MHHHQGLSSGLQMGLGVYYFLVFLLNIGFAAHWHYKQKDAKQASLWSVVSAIFLLHSFLYLTLLGPILPHTIRSGIDYLMGPTTYFVAACIAFGAMILLRRYFTIPSVAFALLDGILLFGGWAMTDRNFQQIITKPDNVPIVLLIFSVGTFTWLGLRKAVVNDDRMRQGQPPLEKTKDDKVLVWPDLVYTELIAMVLATFILVVWSIVLKAPLEQPAASSKIPNPSKAPWYFLGLQEMLVYYDPWMAGVVLPSMIIVGLIAMPFIDYNPKGNGYFTFEQRKFAVSTWMFGFLVLWVTLIVLGTFLRGPNWNFFGPFEAWDPHKNVPLNNRNLSEMFWMLVGKSMDGMHWFWRELPGLLLVIAYMALLPPLLAKTCMRTFFIKMGFVRFFLLVNLIQFMAALPIKMVLRWTINLKYIVNIPEFFFNI